MQLTSLVRIAAALALLSFAALPSLAQGRGQTRPAADAQPPEPAPRWPDGRVNLGSVPGKKGYWEVRPGLGGFPRANDVPFQPWARAVYDYRQATNTKDSPLVACKAAGGPSFFNAPGFEIVDVPELKSIFILNIAGPHSWRVIYMDGRPHPSGDDVRPTFLGHSVGRWEGDTLVIDSVGFNEKLLMILGRTRNPGPAVGPFLKKRLRSGFLAAKCSNIYARTMVSDSRVTRPL